MKSLNQSFLLLNDQFEKILQTKYLPDPEIFTRLSLEECFDYFHRKDPLINYNKIQDNELFDINPLIENKFSVHKASQKEVKYNSILDVLEVISKEKNKNKIINNEINIQANKASGNNNINVPESQENTMNLEMKTEDDKNLVKKCRLIDIENANESNNFNEKESNNKLNQEDVSNNNNNKIDHNLNNNNKNEKAKRRKRNIVPYHKILDENFNSNKTEEGEAINENKGMLVQLRVKDDIINGVILENNKIQCAVSGCEKIFKNKYKLNDHLVTHSKNKQFLCEIENCGREFKRRQTLNRHIRSFHQKITRHPCKFCPAAFTNFNCKNSFLEFLYLYLFSIIFVSIFLALLYHERKFHTHYLPYKCVFRGICYIN